MTSWILSIAEMPPPDRVWLGRDGEICMLYPERNMVISMTQDESYDSLIFDYGAISYCRQWGIFLQRAGRIELFEGQANVYIKRSSLSGGEGAKPREGFLGFPIFNNFQESA